MKEYITTYDDVINNVLKLKEEDKIDCTLSINGKIIETQFTFMSGDMIIKHMNYPMADNNVSITIKHNNVEVRIDSARLIPIIPDTLQKKFVVKVDIHSIWTNIYVIQLEDDNISVDKLSDMITQLTSQLVSETKEHNKTLLKYNDTLQKYSQVLDRNLELELALMKIKNILK